MKFRSQDVNSVVLDVTSASGAMKRMSPALLNVVVSNPAPKHLGRSRQTGRRKRGLS